MGELFSIFGHLSNMNKFIWHFKIVLPQDNLRNKPKSFLSTYFQTFFFFCFIIFFIILMIFFVVNIWGWGATIS